MPYHIDYRGRVPDKSLSVDILNLMNSIMFYWTTNQAGYEKNNPFPSGGLSLTVLWPNWS